MKKQFTLGKNERIKSRKVLDAIFQQGRSFSSFPYRVVYLASQEGLKFAVGVSTKNFKHAVDRNKIKRQTKEAYRLQKINLESVLMQKKTGLNVFFVYTAKEIIFYKQMFDAVEKIIEKIVKQQNETDSKVI